MKKIILKTTALLIALAGLFASCSLFEDDDDDSPIGLIVAPAFNKAVLSLSVAGEGAARTALPSVSSAQEFESFDFEANNGTASITKSWTGDSEKTAYAKMTSDTFEMDAGTWNFTLTAKKGGMTYKGSVEKEITAGANSIEFTLSLAELKKSDKGSMEIKLSVPTKVKAVTATLCYTDERIVSTSGIEQSISLTDSIVSYSAQNVNSYNYLVIFNLYADTEKTLLLGKWREYAVVTDEVTSKSEITIAADDLDELYPITYVLNGGTFKENWSGSYTRRMTFPTQKDLVNNEGLKFDGWYTDAACTQLFDATICSGNLTLYAKWRNWYANEVKPAIRSTELTGTFENPSKITIEGEITFDQLSGITSAMKNCRCYLSLDLAKTEGLKCIYDSYFKGCAYLTGIVIPDTVTEIYNGAFSGCSGLERVTIPSSVTSIGEGAFSGCSGLTEMTIPFVGKSVSATSDWARFIYIFGNSEYSGGIPSSLKTVTVLGGQLKYRAFSGCNGLESVTISEGVTSIGERAFYDCKGLESVTISEGVTSIGECAFYGCSGLESVTIPSSVTSIGERAFSGCSGLTEMTIPFVGESVSATEEASLFGYIFGIGTDTELYYSFSKSFSSKRFSSKSVTYYIPCSLKTVTVLGGQLKDEAFSGCSGVESVTISEGVTSIGKNAFDDCKGLESVTISEGVMGIGDEAFDGCSGLKSVTIPSSVTSIGDYAFSVCSGLESVTISEGVTGIGSHAFYGCSGLESVTIPSSVTSIMEDAFQHCSKLKSVYYGGTVEQWLAIAFKETSPGDYPCSNPCCNGSDLYIQGNKITDLVIPSSVTSIKNCAFYGCSGFESVTIPSSVTSIGEGAFSGCSGLTEMTIPFVGGDFGYIFGYSSYTGGTATEMCGATYYIPGSLKTVTVLGGQLKYGAFSGCSGIESLTIPSSMTSIGQKAFQGCSGLRSVYYGGTLEQWLAMSFEYGSQNPCCNGSDLYIQGTKITDLVIPSGVTSIRVFAFYGCSGLKSVTIPSSVKSIEGAAFSGCSGLESVTIPSSVTSIGSSAFYGCSGLKSVTIPSSVTGIGSSAFSGCSGLESVTIPRSVTEIKKNAFDGCSGLKSVTIPSSVTSIMEGAFDGCSGLTNVYYRGTEAQWRKIAILSGNNKLTNATRIYNYTGK